ncbi:MAG TPA: DUF1573 domain-containing protein [Bacteroidales bacterium]|nr:DUF1573 domain-containing protein [Bacteroidales bacterium]HPS17897.1 DUF1573 domain-containing protein [Bacteroidales bacterium]
MRTKIFIIALLLFPALVISQNKAVIKFDTTSHDFGKIKEEGGNVIYTFFFSNTGTDPLKLTNVKPGCGCTTADWSKDPVLPGQKGYIKTVYNPMNRPGQFHKAITVTSNATVPTQVLIITGEVLARAKTYKDTFTVASGNLRMMSNHIAFMELKNYETKTDTVEILNDWNKPMTFEVTTKLAFAKCIVKPEKLEPKEKGLIILTYDASKRQDWGLIYDYVTIATNDSIDANKTITVSANILEDFSKLTPEQKKTSPKIVFENEIYDFGTIKEGDTAKYTFNFKNNGKGNLIIRKIKASCGCVTTQIINKSVKKKKSNVAVAGDKFLFKKGKSGSIEIVFNSTGRKGDPTKTITVITNDPETPVINLSIKGKVEGK